jgi:APA family basic amino acid/polyamine antiporter
MMAFLPGDTWIRLIVWMVIGFAIYFAYGKSHARTAGDNAAAAAAAAAAAR